MRKRDVLSATIFCLAFFLLSCSVSRNQTPSRIGLVQLKDYSFVNNNTAQDTSYLAIQNEATFANTFISTSGTGKLDLYGKTAVAIVLKNSASLQFDSADYLGVNVNVYAQSCTTSTQSNCSTGNVFLATIPKVGNAKTVHFFIDNRKRGSVQL
jgi:hypothetical protein